MMEKKITEKDVEKVIKEYNEVKKEIHNYTFMSDRIGWTKKESEK